MDAGIILGGQQPDILGAMDKGRAMAESQIGLNRQNALAELYRTQGAQIAAGDQGALNALAGFDPNASLGVQQNILGLQAQKQNMAFSAEEMQMKRDAAKASAAAALQEQSKTLTKEQLAQEQQALSEALSGGAFFYQNKDKAGYDAFLTSKGLDPAEFPFEAFPAHAATVEGVLEAMKAFEPPAGPEWRPATPEEAAANGAIAGQINTVTGKFDLGLQAQQQEIEFSAEKMQMLRDESKREAAAALQAQAATLTAEQLAQEQQTLSEALSGGAFFYQNKDKAGYDAFLASKGLDPAEFPFEAFPAHAASVEGVLEAMKAFEPPAGPEWRPATPEEAAANGAIAGQINTVTGKFDAQNPPSGMALTTNPDGTLTLEQGPGVTGGGRTGKPTEGSLASEGYLQRMKGAEEVFTALEGQGTTALGWTDRPVVDTDFESLKLTEPEQQLLQAQRDWVRAKLRKESGAVIGPEEMAAEIKQYFPQPGEGPAVIAQKKESRKRAEEQLRITALLPEETPAKTEDPAEVKPKRLKFNPATGELE